MLLMLITWLLTNKYCNDSSNCTVFRNKSILFWSPISDKEHNSSNHATMSYVIVDYQYTQIRFTYLARILHAITLKTTG